MMKIKKLRCYPILFIYNNLAIIISRDKKENKTLLEIRTSEDFSVLFKKNFETARLHYTHYASNLIFTYRDSKKILLINLDTFDEQFYPTTYAVFHKFNNCFFGSDMETWDSIILDKKLEVIHNFGKAEIFRSGNYLFEFYKIEEYRSIISIIEPCSGKICWKKEVAGHVSLKYSTEELSFFSLDKKAQDVFQIVESKTGKIMFEENYSVGKIVHEKKSNIIFAKRLDHIVCICLKTWKELRAYKIPNDNIVSPFMSFVGISEVGLMYNHRLSANYFGLIDRKTGEKLWEYDYLHEEADGIVIKQWIPLDNGKHILSCLGKPDSLVLEFEP